MSEDQLKEYEQRAANMGHLQWKTLPDGPVPVSPGAWYRTDVPVLVAEIRRLRDELANGRLG